MASARTRAPSSSYGDSSAFANRQWATAVAMGPTEKVPIANGSLSEVTARQFFLSTSFCTTLPISSRRRQAFSRNEITLSTSASLGSLSSGSVGPAAGGLGTPGTGSPRASSSFFSVAFSSCRRAIFGLQRRALVRNRLAGPSHDRLAALRELVGASIQQQPTADYSMKWPFHCRALAAA